MAHTLGAVISLAASSIRAQEKVREASKGRDEVQVKWEKIDGADESWPFLAKRAIEETRDLLARARDTILQLTRDHEEQLAVQKGRSDSLKAQVTDIMCQVMKVKKLLHICRSKESMSLAELKTLYAQLCNVQGHLHTMYSTIPGV